MSAAVPLIIILVLVGGIVAWGFTTEWTFSGLIPKEGAKCTPKKDDKDENATRYVYDEDGECVVIEKCKTDWEPTTSNTACISSKSGEVCTPTGTKITNGKYTLDDQGACKISSCTGNFALNTAKTACVFSKPSTECTPTGTAIVNGTYTYDTEGDCNFIGCKDNFIKDGTTCRACTAEDVPSAYGGVTAFKTLPGQTYVTENSNCIPKRLIFGGNNGGSNCHTYCAGQNGTHWQGVTAAPPDWKGAKCVGVTAGNDYTKFNTTLTCESNRSKIHKRLNVGNENKCVCERNDATPWVNDGWEPAGGERLFGEDNITRSWLKDTGIRDPANTTVGVQKLKTSSGGNPKNATECLALAKAKGYKALGVRAADKTCWALTAAGLTNGTAMADDDRSKKNNYMVCVDDKTKKVWPGKCA